MQVAGLLYILYSSVFYRVDHAGGRIALYTI